MISRYILSSVSQAAAKKSHSDCSPVVLCSHHFPHVGSSDPATSDFARSVSWSNENLTGGKKKSFWSDSHQTQHTAAQLYHCIRSWGRRSSTSFKENHPFYQQLTFNWFKNKRNHTKEHTTTCRTKYSQMDVRYVPSRSKKYQHRGVKFFFFFFFGTQILKLELLVIQRKWYLWIFKLHPLKEKNASLSN